MEKLNLRKTWFEFVKKTRTSESRKTKRNISHKEGMAIASKLWPAQKAKIIRKHDRAKRKHDKAIKKTVAV